MTANPSGSPLAYDGKFWYTIGVFRQGIVHCVMNLAEGEPWFKGLSENVKPLREGRHFFSSFDSAKQDMSLMASGVNLCRRKARERNEDKMVSMTGEYDKSMFSTASSLELNKVDLSELIRRRDELLFLKNQYDPDKSMEDLRYSCIEQELAEVERRIAVLNSASRSPDDDRRSSAEEDLLRQGRIG